MAMSRTIYCDAESRGSLPYLQYIAVQALAAVEESARVAGLKRF